MMSEWCSDDVHGAGDAVAAASSSSRSTASAAAGRILARERREARGAWLVVRGGVTVAGVRSKRRPPANAGVKLAVQRVPELSAARPAK